MPEAFTRLRRRERVFLFSTLARVRATSLPRRRGRRGWAAAMVGVMCCCFMAGCTPVSQHSTPRRDINAVLADHDDELLALPGVAGVYIGLLSDEKTPCLKVMLVRQDARLKRRIPRTLEGHPVVTEVTGEIRPLQ